MKNLAVRVLVAIIAIPILVNIVLFGKALLVGFVSILTVLAFFEFMKMTQTRIRLFPQMILFGWLVFANWSVFYFGEGALLLSLLIGFAITTFSAVFRRDVVLSSTRVVFTLFGLIYVSLFNFFILIRELELIKYMNYKEAGLWILFAFAVIWICDTAAYFVGTPLGKHKMSPVVSPNKSWEGFAGGMVFGTLTGYIFSFFALKEIPILQMILAAFAVSLTGQLGDLVESIFKRRFGVKDSSNIIPGHGGVLDRFDSLLFALPTLYFILVFVVYSD
ncbi:MAG: phosphatidate cytidylyltransferase [candidate division Zixibacteria bacterium]|nr:phosphatidate cytidylyltransferase [candidate division Zixibacteria bacterium]